MQLGMAPFVVGLALVLADDALAQDALARIGIEHASLQCQINYERDFRRQVSCLTRVINESDQNAIAEVLRDRARVYFWLGEYQRTIDDTTRASSLEPRNEYSHLLRGRAREELRDYSTAVADYGAAIEVNPELSDGRFRRGILLRRAGDGAGATRDFEAIIASGIERQARLPDNYIPAGEICGGHAISGLRLQEGIPHCDAAVRLCTNGTSDCTWRRFYRALLRLRLSEHSAALADFDLLLTYPPVDPAWRYGRGLTLAALGRTSEAHAEIQAARAEAPDIGELEFHGLPVP